MHIHHSTAYQSLPQHWGAGAFASKPSEERTALWNDWGCQSFIFLPAGLNPGLAVTANVALAGHRWQHQQKPELKRPWNKYRSCCRLPCHAKFLRGSIVNVCSALMRWAQLSERNSASWRVFFMFKYKFPFKCKSKNRKKLYTPKKSLQPAPRYSKLPHIFLADVSVTQFSEDDLPSAFWALQGKIFPGKLSQELTLLSLPLLCPLPSLSPVTNQLVRCDSQIIKTVFK